MTSIAEEKEEQVSLPHNYPLLAESRDDLRKERPPAKATYSDKYVQPFLAGLQKSLIETIGMKLEISAQKYRSGETSDDEYSKVKDMIYNSISKEDWIDGVHDAFRTYSASNDAYSLLLHVAFQTTQQKVTISNLYDYVSKESEAIENGLPLPFPSLTEVFDEELEKVKSQNEEGKNLEKDAVRHFRQIMFVAVYPERPIPSNLEEDNDNDDLEVDGGKVDLTCPISREIFVKPYRNKQCKHTYDLEPLKIYLRSSQECPECGVPLRMETVEPDLIMQTRVECYKRDKKLEDLVKDRRMDDTEKL